MFLRAVGGRGSLSGVRLARSMCGNAGNVGGGEGGDLRRDILDAALLRVPEHGWSRESLAAAACSLGLPSVSHGIVAGGETELVEHFMAQGTERAVEAMAQRAATGELARLPLHARVGVGLRARLEHTAPFVLGGSWPQAMAIGALPSNALGTAQCLTDMSEQVWVRAVGAAGAGAEEEGGGGGGGGGGNRYIATALITGTYVSTELFMLSDASAGHEQTWAFLEARLGELGDWQRDGLPTPSVQQVQDVASALATGAAAIASALPSMMRAPPGTR
jgi:ubiquinone biosynthesis protein COQ9